MAATAFIMTIVMIFGTGSYRKYHQSEYPTEEACYKAIEKSKITISHGAENEATVVMWCHPSKDNI